MKIKSSTNLLSIKGELNHDGSKVSFSLERDDKRNAVLPCERGHTATVTVNDNELVYLGKLLYTNSYQDEQTPNGKWYDFYEYKVLPYYAISIEDK